MKKLLILIVLFFTGCANSSFSNNSLPNWYLNAPNNTDSMLYGTGEGDNLKEAKTNAIDDMAARLSVKVGSSYSQKTITYNDSYEKLVTKEINLSVENFTFNNAKVLNSSQNYNKTYVLMEVARKEVFDKLFSEFNQIDRQIKNKIFIAQNLSEYEKLKIIYSLNELITKASLKSDILKAVNKNFNQEEYLNYYSNAQNNLEQIKQNLAFNVEINSQNQIYAREISSLIVKKGFKVNNSSNIKIETIINGANSIANGFNVFRDVVTINIKVDGKIVSSAVIEAKGVSQNQQNALNKAARDFASKIDLDKLIFGE